MNVVCDCQACKEDWPTADSIPSIVVSTFVKYFVLFNKTNFCFISCFYENQRLFILLSLQCLTEFHFSIQLEKKIYDL